MSAGLQINDMQKAAGVVADMRKVFRQDTRIIQKLHRRVFIDKITTEQVGAAKHVQWSCG